MANAGEPKRPMPRDWRGVFLRTLAETSNVTRAAAAAGVPPGQAYRIRRANRAFADAWFAALCEGYDHLEMEVLERLREGRFAGTDGGKYDFGAALRILAAHRDTIARQRALGDDDDEEAVLASINARIDAIRVAELDGIDPPAARDGARDGIWDGARS